MKRIALTCGDPAGIGPEIISKWLKDNPEVAKLVCPIGPKSWIGTLSVDGIVVGADDFELTPGNSSEEGSKVAVEAMEVAAKGTQEGDFSGVITGPISKQNCKKAGFFFPGQTEFFESRWGGTASMAFSGDKLRVVLATWHIPISEVSSFLTLQPNLIEQAIERADLLCRLEGIKNPRIGVCGLNPHAGEGGTIGKEEVQLINPLLDKQRKKYENLSPCLSADTIFGRMIQGEFDVIVSMYHDQALAPLKTLEFDQAVNVTLGLPHLRCSPDHGTAFDIAGKGLARTTSLEAAYRWIKKVLDKPSS